MRKEVVEVQKVKACTIMGTVNFFNLGRCQIGGMCWPI